MLDKTVPTDRLNGQLANQLTEAYKGELKRGTALSRPRVACVARIACVAVAGMILAAAPGRAQAIDANTTPTGGVVTGGDATISYPASNQLEVNQNSNRAYIDWQSFDIGADASAEFFQPSSNAVAVNRVNGSVNPTQILGSLSANGNVIILDPNGVFFGAGAVVDVGGIVASTGDIDAASFMAGGTINITGIDTGASVINAGTITAAQGGLVGFVAPHVANSGVITANLGTVQLSSGAAATLDLYGDGLVEIAVTGAVADALSENSGEIAVDGGRVVMSANAASGVVDNVINMSGVIDASSFVVTPAGEIILDGGDNGIVSVAGSMDSHGTQGGTITITGKNVDITETAVIDVSGTNGGGTLYIGGEYQGGGTTRTAENTIVREGATISANATDDGDGGTVIVWADNNAIFHGSVDARGGANGGNGGFVETSGVERLEVSAEASVDVSASNGTGGEWLLDPRTLIISSFNSGVTSSDPFEPDSGGLRRPSYLDVAVLLAALDNGTSVTVNTVGSPEGILDGDGDIIVDATITKTAGGDATLTMTAANDILFQSLSTGISSTSGALNLAFDADGGIILSDKAINTNGGFIDFTAETRIDISDSIITGGGNAYLRTNEGVNITGLLDAGAGTVMFSRIGGPGVISLGDDNGGLVVSQASLDNITAATLQAGDSANADDIGAIVSNADLSGFADARFVTGDVTFNGVNTVDGLSINTAGTATVNGTLGGSGAASVNAAQFALNGAMTAASADITSADDVTIAGSLNTTGDVTLSAGATLNGDDLATSSVVDIAGSVTTGGGDFTSNGGMFNVSGTVDSGAGALTINNTGLWQAAANSLNTSGDIALKVSTATGGQGFREVVGGNSGLTEALAAAAAVGGQISISADAGDYNGGLTIGRDNVALAGNNSAVQVAPGGTGFTVAGNDISISGFSFNGDGTGTGLSATGVSGLTLTNTGFDANLTGLSFDGVSNATVDGGLFTGNATGFDMANGSNISLTNSTLDGDAVSLRAVDTDALSVTGNMFLNTGTPLDFTNVTNLVFSGNNINLPEPPDPDPDEDYGFVISGISDAVIEDNIISGYGIAGVLIEDANETVVRNNTISGNPIGVWVRNSNATHVTGNIFEDNDVAVQVENSHNTHITNNSFTGGTAGIAADHGSNLHIMGNSFDGLDGDAVFVDSYTNMHVKDNDFMDIGGDAVSLGGVWFVQVKDNDLTNIGGDGIVADGVFMSSFSGNDIDNVAGDGISASHGLFVSIKGNDLSGVGGNAISVDSVLFASVRDNDISNTGYVAPEPEPEPTPAPTPAPEPEPEPEDDAENNTGNGVSITGSGFVSVSGNDIDETQNAAISVADSAIVSVRSNSVVGAATGVEASSNGFVSISNNDISGTGDAIVTEDNGHQHVRNNDIDGETQDGDDSHKGKNKKKGKKRGFFFWRW